MLRQLTNRYVLAALRSGSESIMAAGMQIFGGRTRCPAESGLEIY